MSLADAEPAAPAALAPAPTPASGQAQEGLSTPKPLSAASVSPDDQEGPQMSDPALAPVSATSAKPSMSALDSFASSSTAPISQPHCDKGGLIPTSNALSSSLKSRLSTSAPLSSLSSTTPTTIISPKPSAYGGYSPATSAALLSAASSSLLMLSSSKNAAATSGPETSSSDALVKTEDLEHMELRSLSPETHGSSRGPSSSPARQSSSDPMSAKKENKAGVTATSCANCGTTTTPLWRRASNGQTICNACGLYFKARNLTRPPWLKRNIVHKKGDGTDEGAEDSEDGGSVGNVESSTAKINSSESAAAKAGGDAASKISTNDSECAGSCPGDGNCNGEGGAESCAGCPSFNQHQANRQNLVCANCRTTTTPLWRRDSSGNTICNACGLYFKLHNVHRPVTMKRAVIKRRKRVHLLATSPPPAPASSESSQAPKAAAPASSGQPLTPTKPRRPKQKLDNPQPAVASDMDQSDMDSPAEVQAEMAGHTATKRRRVQELSSGRGVPAIEDFIQPKRSANGQTEWLRHDHATSGHRGRRSTSPMDMSGSGHDDHGRDRSHHDDRRYSSSHHASHDHGSSYSPHLSNREHVPSSQSQSSRYNFNLHQGNGQYQSSQSMSMSRYPAHPPPLSRYSPPVHHRHSHSEYDDSHAHSKHHHLDDEHHPQSITMQGYQGLHSHHPSDMDDVMHSPSGFSSYSSGWNQRLPGYATVTSSAFNTRLSSTGVVRSGHHPNSPPLYPRQGHAHSVEPYSHYHRSDSPSNRYHRAASPLSSRSLSHSPPMQNGHAIPHHSYSSTTSANSSYGGAHHHHHHHSLPSIMNPPSHGSSGDGGGTGGPAHLPPISLPSPHHSGGAHHQSLPRASEILQRTPEPASLLPHHRNSSPHRHHQQQQQQQQQQHHYQQRSSSPGPPPPAPPLSLPPMNGVSTHLTAPSALSGSLANKEVLQQTREDLQREVSHLSMLLGRAAAVLNGLDQALGPNGAKTTAPNSGGEAVAAAESGVPLSLTLDHAVTDTKTSSALASLMALSASGGERTAASGSRPSSTTAGSLSPLVNGASSGRQDDRQMHSPMLPTPHSASPLPSSLSPPSTTRRQSHALPYPLPRRE